MANIDIQQQLNDLLKEQNKLIAAQTKLQKSQLEMTKSMVAAMQKMSAEEASQTFRSMSAAIKDADEALNEFSTNQQKTMKEASESTGEAGESLNVFFKKLEKAGQGSIIVGALVTSFQGLFSSVSSVSGIFGSLMSVTGGLISSLGNLTTSIISIPFKAMSALMEEAASYSGTELRQAIEDLRGEMGQLSTNEGEAVMHTFRTMSKQGTETGKSLYRVFGNRAEQLKEMNRIATAMGRNFGNLSAEMREHGRQIGEYTNGLGLSEEGIKAVAARADMTGKSFREIGREITTMAFGMGDAFGINGKLISRDISEMVKDVDNFGSIGVKEMSQISVYTRKLGIEIKDLLGLVGQFDDFESAAGATAQLSQAFGLQLDTLEMLKEQDPAARFEQIRKAWQATGKDVDKLHRQELSLLATQTGLSAEALKLGLSQSKAGLSYEEVQKQAGATEKKQLSQAEAMEKLSDSIKLMVKSGEQMKGGFFDIFIKGFSKGIKHSEPWRNMMKSLNHAMRATLHVGRQIGNMFMTKMMPGIEETEKGVMGIFKAFNRFEKVGDKWVRKGFLANIIESFRAFSQTLRTDPRASLRKLFGDLKKNFFDFLDEAEPSGKETLNGMTSFFDTIKKLFAAGIEIAAEGLTKGLTGMFQFITDLIRDPSSIVSGANQAQTGVSKFLMDIFGPAFNVLKEQWPMLRDAAVELFNVAWEAAKPHLTKWANKAWEWVNDLMWSMMIGRIITAAILAGVAEAAKRIQEGGSRLLTRGLDKMFSMFTKSKGFKNAGKQFSNSMEAVTGAGGAVNNTGKAMGKMNLMAMGKAVLVGITAITLTAGAVALAYIGISKLFKSANVTESDAELVTKSMQAAAWMFGVTAAVMLVSFAAGSAIIGSAGLAAGAIAAGIAAVVATAAIMAGATIKLIASLNEMKMSSGIHQKVEVFKTVMDAMMEIAKFMTNAASSSVLTNLAGAITGRNIFKENLEAIASAVESVSKPIIQIVGYVAELTKGIDFRQLRGISMIAGLMVSIGELVKALMPSEDLTPSSIENVLGVPVLDKITQYMSSVISIIRHQAVPAITEMLTSISEMPEINSEKINIFSTFMSSLGGLMQAMQPSSGMLEMMTNADNKSFWTKLIPFVDKQEGSATVMDKMSKMMKSMIDSMIGEDGVISKIGNVMKGVVDAVGKMGEVDKINSSIAVFRAAVGAVSDIAELFNEDTFENIETANDLGGGGMILDNFNKNIIRPMIDELPAIIKSFDSVEANVKEVNDVFVKKVAGGIKDMVSQINEVTETLNSIGSKDINTTLKQTADKLGLSSSKQLQVKINDINLTINIGVQLEAEKFEKTLIGRPGGSKFLTK